MLKVVLSIIFTLAVVSDAGTHVPSVYAGQQSNSDKQLPQHSVSLNLHRVEGGGVVPAPGSPAKELSELVQLQRDKLQALESRLLGCEAEMQDWEDSAGEASEVSTNKLPGKETVDVVCSL